MHSYRFGIEEEYFLVDRRTATIRRRLPERFMRDAKRYVGPSLMYELLQSQIEVATKPQTIADDARRELKHFRSTLAEIGEEHDVGIVAAGTHPGALPHQQVPTRKRRYTKIIDDLGMVGTGNPVCALHVHVEVPQPDKRIELMHRLEPFLPILLALSTSSPFWAGCETGLLGYRSAANDMMPRSGLPENFTSLSEYECFVHTLVGAGIIPDASHIWWALRPSLAHPTLELRITDSCTSVDDAIAIASLYRCIVRHLVNDTRVNARTTPLMRAFTTENTWRAQRYGIYGTFIDETTHELISFKHLLTCLLARLEDDAIALDLTGELGHLKVMIERGTSAHQQLHYYRLQLESGASESRSIEALCKWLLRSTEHADFVIEPPGRDPTRSHPDAQLLHALSEARSLATFLDPGSQPL
jgi:glutamate---cysteine ligase / carboxylate-amine ligase